MLLYFTRYRGALVSIAQKGGEFSRREEAINQFRASASSPYAESRTSQIKVRQIARVRCCGNAPRSFEEMRLLFTNPLVYHGLPISVKADQ